MGVEFSKNMNRYSRSQVNANSEDGFSIVQFVWPKMRQRRRDKELPIHSAAAGGGQLTFYASLSESGSYMELAYLDSPITPNILGITQFLAHLQEQSWVECVANWCCYPTVTQK